MRILFVSHYVLPHVGGIEVVIDQLGRTMAGLGHDVTVIAGRTGSDQLLETVAGVKIERIETWNVLEEKLHVPVPIFSPALVFALRRRVRETDVVHAHGLLYTGTWIALIWARRFKKPFILTEHVGFVPYRNPLLNLVQQLALNIAARSILRRVDATVTINGNVREWLMTVTGGAQVIHTIRNGVDCDRFRPASSAERIEARRALGLPLDRPLVLFVGRFVEKKGIGIVLGLPGDTYNVVVCGSGVVNVATPPFWVLMDVRQDRMHEVYRAADVFVLPSHGEGFPMSIMEAMATGLPVVVARDPTYSSYVQNDEIVQVEPTCEALGRAVSELLANSSMAAALGNRARTRAVTDFALSSSARSHLELYSEALGGTK